MVTMLSEDQFVIPEQNYLAPTRAAFATFTF